MSAEPRVESVASVSDLSRRGVFRGVAVAGLAAPLLAACGDDEPSTSGDGAEPETEESEAAPEGGEALGATADIPVGGGTVFADQKVVVTQPTEGDFLAFTAVCTHQGCIVAEVTDTINCNCHGSKYSIEDGSVVNGPAPDPLEEVAISTEGDEITLS